MRSNFLDRTFVLPPNLAPGTQIYRANIEFRCNLLQRFWPLVVRTPELQFRVIAPPTKQRDHYRIGD